MSKAGRAAIAILVGGAVLLVAAWSDSTVMLDIQRQTARSFDYPYGLQLALSLGSLAVVGSVLLLAALAWRSKSGLVGAVYAVVGVFLVFLPVISWRFAAQINDAPPVLPQPIAQAVSEIYFRSTGPLNAVVTIGAGMLIIGLIVLVRSYRGRTGARTSQPLTTVEGRSADLR